MGLFSRSKKRRTESALDSTTTEPADTEQAEQAEQAELTELAEPADDGAEAENAEGADAADTSDATRAGDSANAANTAEPDEADPAPRGEHLEDGPYDVADAPEEDRIDLGGLQVPTIDGMELRMEVDQRTSAVTGANLVIGGSSLQVQAFAAPKSRGLWEEVRTSLRDSVVKQGGTAESRPGAFGTELITRLPVKRTDGRTGYRPARFIGIDGRRWFLRAILTGKALSDKEQAKTFETLISRLVVVRGGEAMAPQELIPLGLPGQRPGLSQVKAGPLDPLARGPEITEIG